jgi:hypothetical protein
VTADIPEGRAPFADFAAGADLAYALDDGMPFPGWTPPLLTDDEARAGYAAGERMAVIAGEPSDPAAGLVLDRKNARLALRRAEPAIQLVYAGEPLTLTEALWWDASDRECWARRTSHEQLRISRRPRGAALWVEELLAHVDAHDRELVDWPEFGAWDALTSVAVAPWIEHDVLDLVDADGWMLDALEAAGVTATWRELGRKYDAPRAFGLPPDVQEKIAIPLGWEAAGRRWRKADEIVGTDGQPSTEVTTDAMFAAGAGASGEVVTTVSQGKVKVVLGLPAAVGRVETRAGKPASPSHPRPSTGAQVAVTAILDAGGLAHDAIVQAVRDGAVPTGWEA